MSTVLLATQKPFSKKAVASIRSIIEQAGHTLQVVENYADEKALRLAIRDADAVIIRSDLITEGVVAAAKSLKLVVRAGSGYDNVDLSACKLRDVVVMNTPGQNSNAVAELAVGLMIYSVRNMFQPGTGGELRGKKLGLHAYGHVAKLLAHHAQALGMDVYAYDPYVADEVMENTGVSPLHAPEELYASSDYLSLHLPSSDNTNNSIGLELLSLLPTGATVLNTARQEIINEAELARILKERSDLKYIADVMPKNYLTIAEEFPGRVYSTPKKMGAETAEANQNAGLAAARQIVSFLSDGDVTFQVN